MQPATGFGFGDAVIVELLKDKGLLPDLGHQVDDMVMVMGDGVGAYAAGVAAKLRASGRSVELVLEVRRLGGAVTAPPHKRMRDRDFGISNP